MTRRLRFCTIILLAAAASWLSSHAYAVTTNWIADSGLFTTAANWDNGVPDSGDTAIFNRGFVGYTVTFPGGTIFEPPVNYAITYLRVNNNHVNFVWDSSFPLQASPTLSVLASGVSIVVGENAGEVGILGTTLAGFSGANTSIGRAPGASGTLNVVGGTFSMSGNIDVGDSGTGTLNITNGGMVASTDGFIGAYPGSNGHVTVSGANSTWSSNSVHVGRSFDPVLNARLDVNDGGLVSVSNLLRINLSGQLAGNGRIQGNVENRGRVAPGISSPTSVGTLHIDGNYNQQGGELFVEISAADSFDKLDVDGNITLSGELRVSLLGGYSPEEGDTFDFLDWTGTRMGRLSHLELPPLAAGLRWRTTQFVETGVLSVVPAYFQPGEFVTYSQDSWGDAPSPGNAAFLLSQQFDNEYPAGVEVGVRRFAGFSMLFLSAAAVNGYLPAGGPNGPLNADLVDPTSSASGEFGGHVLALQLDVDFNDSGILTGSSSVAFGDLVLTKLTELSHYNGLSVRQYLAEQNGVLGDTIYVDSYDTVSNLSRDITLAFEGGAPSEWAQDHLRFPGDFNGDRAIDAADYVVWRKTDGTQRGYNEWRANFGRTGASGATAGLTSSANAAVPEPACAALVCLAMAGLWMVVRSRSYRQ